MLESLWKPPLQFLIKSNVHRLNDKVILLLGIYLREMKRWIQEHLKKKTNNSIHNSPKL